MKNLNALNRETLIDIILDLDNELFMIYGELIPNLEHRIQMLEEETMDLDKKRRYWKDKAMKYESKRIPEDNGRILANKNKRKVPVITMNDGTELPVNIISQAQGNTYSFRDYHGIPITEQKEETPDKQRKEETEPRRAKDGGNWMRSQHIWHKREGVGYEAEFQHDVKNRSGEVVVREGDVYQFPDLRSVEEFYIGKGIKKPNWRANNLSTAITRRGGYMDSALWKYIKMEIEKGD